MGKLIIENSVVTFYRRSLTPADSLISDAGVNPYPSIDMKVLSVEEGQWVSRDSDGKAVAITTPVRLAYAVWGGNRQDAAAASALTVIAGVFIAKTNVFDASPTGGGDYAVGTPLTVRNGQLDKAGASEPINAIAEGPVSDPSTEYPDGLLEFNTFQCFPLMPA